jgi:predicted secreted protein
MFKIFLFIAVIAAIVCLCFAVACLFAAYNENQLPDIEDVEVDEIITSES